MSIHRQFSLGRGMQYTTKNTIWFRPSPVCTIISFSMLLWWTEIALISPHLFVFGITDEGVFCFSKGLQDVWCFFIFTGHGWWHRKKKKSFEVGKVLSHRMRAAWKETTLGDCRAMGEVVVPPSERKRRIYSKGWASLSEIGCMFCLMRNAARENGETSPVLWM